MRPILSHVPGPDAIKKIIIFTGLTASLLVCGGGGGGSAPPAGSGITGQVINVGASGSVFTPDTLTIKAGTPVTFVWISGGHTVTSGSNCVSDGKFGGAAILSAGQTLSVPSSVVNTPGTYPFFCTTHCGQAMKGTLTVTP